MIILDIPLLFEVGEHENVDVIICVVTNKITQKQRVLSRGNMSESEFLQILARQMPIEEKVKRSDFVIRSDNLEKTKKQVLKIFQQILIRKKNA